MDNLSTSVPVLLTRLEASKRLRCSLTTLDRLEIPFVKIRRRIYYRPEMVNAWLLANEHLKERQS